MSVGVDEGGAEGVVSMDVDFAGGFADKGMEAGTHVGGAGFGKSQSFARTIWHFK